MPSRLVDGNDVFAVHEAAREAVAHCRRGAGPFFLECTTYRWREHVGPLWDYDKGYRSKAEVDSWIARCPIRRAAERCSRRRCTPRDSPRWSARARSRSTRRSRPRGPHPSRRLEDLTLGTY